MDCSEVKAPLFIHSHTPANAETRFFVWRRVALKVPSHIWIGELSDYILDCIIKLL